MTFCPGCEGARLAIEELAHARELAVDATAVKTILDAVVCQKPVDYDVNPAAIEHAEEWFQCSRPVGHKGAHMACSLLRGWNSPHDIERERHPAYVWGSDIPPDFSHLKAELAWLQGAT